MKKYALLCIGLTAALLMSACGNRTNGTEPTNYVPAQFDSTDVFTDRDYETGYDESKSTVITLNGDTAACNCDTVQISGGTVTITDEGTYVLSGTLNDGMIVVNSEKTDKIQLVLDGVTIHSETSAPIYILQADKVFITLSPDSANVLSNGGTFTAIDENNIDAVLFSKEDVTLNGSGTLTINSPAGHGIVSKDSLAITGGAYDISAACHALTGQDDVCVTGAAFTLTSGKDGIHAENAEDTSLGFVYIESGSFQISAEGDGISASAAMQIMGGTFHILSGGGSVNAPAHSVDPWGGGMGGGRHPGGMGGGPMGNNSSGETQDDTASMKGVKAGGDLTIRGGVFTIDSADDAVHSNANIAVCGGTFEIASGDDAFHADETLAISSGDINITQSYEGLEGLHIDMSGGDITLVASDDGLNAAGGTDQSGFGGPHGNDRFGGMGGGASNGSIVLSGGTIRITASGDGIDANGRLTISGGFVTVCGPTQGDTATLDYDSSATITGGTFIGTGASGMAQTFSDSEQGVIAVRVDHQNAGTKITLTDSEGNVILFHTPELPFALVILSSPDVIKGQTYTITVGSASGQFEAD